MKRRKLNSDGFSHVELLIVIALVLAVASVGFLTYRSQHKNSVTAHAGSPTLVGTIKASGEPNITVYACGGPNSSEYTYVKAWAIISSGPAVNSSTTISMGDFSAPNYTSKRLWITWTGNWPKSTAYLYHTTNPHVSNYLIFTAQYYYIGPYSTRYIRAGSLAQC
ncbi:MAG TPA: hypothetical protein VMR18_04470 [Candidatus Saccharimonadales bacterium]|nr:hypothetical protein [Candidatus Saccharimonadales bacterium]